MRVANDVVQIPDDMDQERTSLTTPFSQRDNILRGKEIGDPEDPSGDDPSAEDDDGKGFPSGGKRKRHRNKEKDVPPQVNCNKDKGRSD